MAVHDILSQDEVDALLNGLGDGELESAPDTEDNGEGHSPRKYDFGNQERIIRGRMPTLEMVVIFVSACLTCCAALLKFLWAAYR